MTAYRDPSVEELRQESERSRAALTTTVAELRDKVSDTADDLKERLSPAHIKEEVKDYVREGGEQLFHTIERKARENPLQALAIGAGLAYPLLGILRSIPAPLMLIGAGIWLSRHGSGSNGSGGMATKAAELGAQGMNRMADAARGAADGLSARAEAATDRARAAAHDLRDSVSETAEAVAGSVKDLAGSMQEKVASATNSLSATASDAVDTAAQMSRQSRNAVMDLVDRNPLAVAGVGLAIGAFVAACLPASEAENRIFGETSDDLKDKALQATAQGVERAKDVAAGVAGDVATAAAREGLNLEGANKAVEGVTSAVKSVVDRGLDTALGAKAAPASASSNQSNKT